MKFKKKCSIRLIFMYLQNFQKNKSDSYYLKPYGHFFSTIDLPLSSYSCLDIHI